MFCPFSSCVRACVCAWEDRAAEPSRPLSDPGGTTENELPSSAGTRTDWDRRTGEGTPRAERPLVEFVVVGGPSRRGARRRSP